MRIFHMIGHMRLGAGRYVVETCLRQASHYGHDVTVLVSPDVEGNWKTDPVLVTELQKAGIPVLCAGDFFHRQLGNLSRSASYIRRSLGSELDQSVCHAHSAMAAAVSRWAGAGRVVATCHGFDLTRPGDYDLQDALALRLCDAVTTPSRYWAGILHREMGVPQPFVIPVGLDLNRYPPLSRRPWRDGVPIRIVTVCELTFRKGVDLLIDAMAHIWERYPTTELHIIGDGEAAASLREQSGRMGQRSGQIRFHGFVADPYPGFAGYDLFALASRSDNLPVAVIEAMLAGLPVVAAKAGGIPEMILGARAGSLAEPESATSLAKTVIDILGRGETALGEMSARAQSYARSRFGIEKTVAHLERVYRWVKQWDTVRGKTAAWNAPTRPPALTRHHGGDGTADFGEAPQKGVTHV